MRKLFVLLLALTMMTAFAAPAFAVERIIVLNNAHSDLALSSNRYNAYWLNAWSIAQVVEDNFWFDVAPDTLVSVVAYSDYYTDESNTFEALKNKHISLKFNDEYDVICGPNQSMNAAVQYMGYIVAGPEALLFMQEDGWKMDELFEDVGMAKADRYVFHAADDYTHVVDADKLGESSIEFVDGRIDGVLPGLGKYTLYNVRYIYVEGADQEGFEPLEGVNKITVFENAEGVYGEEAPEVTNFGGVLYDSFAVKDLLDKFEIPVEGEVTAISFADGSTKTESVELFAQKFMAMTSSKGTHPFTLGQIQPRNDVLQKVGYYVLAKNAFFFLPEPTEGVDVANVPFTEIFEKAGMVEAAEYKLTATDGFSWTVSADELAECFVGWVDGRPDAIIPGLGGQSMYYILSIEAVTD